ncbi:alpha/beta fold hydrolase, partial [Rhizobium sp. SEMIA 4085]|uniref:alpha/beta hydrolase n=1 Tax=Rhizobium sp. SEMIA 4085 TaxID=2137761 RepID=UPI00147859A5
MQKLAIYCAAIATTFGAAPTFAEVERKDFRVNAAPDIELAIREVRKTGPERKGPPIILVHGARVPGIASFDLPVEGGSLAADLATRGYRVFIVDARGYGRSDRPGQDGPPEGRPLTHSNEVARDIDAAVEAIRDRTDSRQVGLLGWATGGPLAGMDASRFLEEGIHLVVCDSRFGPPSGHTTHCTVKETTDP